MGIMVEDERIRARLICVPPYAILTASNFQHVHLSDNLFSSTEIPVSKVYAKSRSRSSQSPPLTPHVDETYSREEFDAF